MTPCLHIPNRFHHGPCECFTGGDAGEWWHEGLGATESDRNDAGDLRTARTQGARALGGQATTTEGEAP